MRNAYAHIEAEGFNGQSGTRVESDPKSPGTRLVSHITPGDWLRYDNVDFTGTAPRAFTAKMASGRPGGANGFLQVRVGHRSNAPVASFRVPDTGGWSSFHAVAVSATPPTGRHTVFVTFSGDQAADLLKLDWIVFNGPHG